MKCPILLAVELHEKCKKGECQWWTGAYTTENKTVYDCAMKIIAMKRDGGAAAIDEIKAMTQEYGFNECDCLVKGFSVYHKKGCVHYD